MFKELRSWSWVKVEWFFVRDRHHIINVFVLFDPRVKFVHLIRWLRVRPPRRYDGWVIVEPLILDPVVLPQRQQARAEGLVVRNKAYAYIAEHPGVKAEDVGTALRIDNREMLSRMIAHLKDGGYVKGKGATRNMVYTTTKKVYKP